jgi:hypothetical protein
MAWNSGLMPWKRCEPSGGKTLINKMRDENWDELLKLTRESGLSTERVCALRERITADRAPGAATVVVTGITETRFVEFLAPALVGVNGGPRDVHVCPIPKGQEERITASVAPFDPIDLVVLVSRVSQPLTPRECDLVRRLNPLVAMVRVVFLALPAEEPSPSELAELRSLATIKMKQLGFVDGRALIAEVWSSWT